MRWDSRRCERRRLRPWVARAVYTILAVLFGLGMGYVAWGAGEDWSQMPDGGRWSPQAGLVMDELGYHPEPFHELPPWEPWKCRGVPIRGRFGCP